MTKHTGACFGGATTTIPAADTRHRGGTGSIVPLSAADQTGRIAHDADTGNGGTQG